MSGSGINHDIGGQGCYKVAYSSITPKRLILKFRSQSNPFLVIFATAPHNKIINIAK